MELLQSIQERLSKYLPSVWQFLTVDMDASSKVIQLPRELRDEIYFYAMVPKEQISWCDPGTYNICVLERGRRSHARPKTLSSLLRVSRQTNKEATRILCTRFTFFLLDRVCMPGDIDETTLLLGKGIQTCIQSVGFDLSLSFRDILSTGWNSDELAQPFRDLRARLPGLKTVMLTIRLLWETSDDWLDCATTGLMNGFEVLDGLQRVMIRLNVSGGWTPNQNTVSLLHQRLKSRFSNIELLEASPPDSIILKTPNG